VLKLAAELPCPALFTYGSKELASGGIAFAGLPEALMALANAERRTLATIEAADHFYAGVTQNLADAAAGWLRENLLSTEY
jgi:alpha/beta superfamily hydrolase